MIVCTLFVPSILMPATSPGVLLKGTYQRILAKISESPFIQFDESVLKGNGRKLYA